MYRYRGNINMCLENIDKILKNLEKDKNYYNHGMSEEKYLELEQRED